MQNKSLLERTLAKMEKSQQKKKEIFEYMQKNKPYLLGSIFKSNRIKNCCNVLMFHDYLNGEQKLYKSNFCKYDKFCLACSTRRSIRMIQRFEQGIKENGLDKKNWYHITLTIRHRKEQKLKTVLEKLCRAKEKLAKSYRNSKRKIQKKKSFMYNFDGIVSSIEITYNERNGWHPHIHILACTDKELPIEKLQYSWGNKELQAERLKITKDSNQISMRKIKVDSNSFDRRGIGEVFKYAVKFSTLDVPHLVDLIELQHQKKYHFFSTYGVFRGWKLDKKIDNEDKNYVEKMMVYFNDEYNEVQDVKSCLCPKKRTSLNEVIMSIN